MHPDTFFTVSYHSCVTLHLLLRSIPRIVFDEHVVPSKRTFDVVVFFHRTPTIIFGLSLIARLCRHYLPLVFSTLIAAVSPPSPLPLAALPSLPIRVCRMPSKLSGRSMAHERSMHPYPSNSDNSTLVYISLDTALVKFYEHTTPLHSCSRFGICLVSHHPQYTRSFINHLTKLRLSKDGFNIVPFTFDILQGRLL